MSLIQYSFVASLLLVLEVVESREVGDGRVVMAGVAPQVLHEGLKVYEKSSTLEDDTCLGPSGLFGAR
jgi:hypothetical protein